MAGVGAPRSGGHAVPYLIWPIKMTLLTGIVHSAQISGKIFKIKLKFLRFLSKDRLHVCVTPKITVLGHPRGAVYLVGRPHEIPLLNIGRFQVTGSNC